MMAAGTAHMRMREHSTVTRSDQAELRRDARRTGPAVKSLRAFPTGRAPSTSQDKYRTSAAVPVTISRRMRNWLLSDDADPSLRYRVLRELLDRPSDDPEVLAAQKQIGREGWAAKILQLQHPGGQWDTAGNSARELYRPKYVATNWRLLVLSDLEVRRTHPRIVKAVKLFLRRFGGPSGDLGGRKSEVCFTGNAVRIPRPSIGTIVDRLAPATSEVRRWLALLPLSNGDLGWLGGLSGLRGDPGGEAFGRDASSHRTRSGVLSRTRPASRRANAVCTVDAITLPGPLLLRPIGRRRRPHVARIRRRPSHAFAPRPAGGKAEPGRDMESRRPPPGHGGPELPNPGALLPVRPRSAWPPEPVDHRGGPQRPPTAGPLNPGAACRSVRSHAAGRARTGDFEIFSLALSQTELPRRKTSDSAALINPFPRGQKSTSTGGTGMMPKVLHGRCPLSPRQEVSPIRAPTGPSSIL